MTRQQSKTVRGLLERCDRCGDRVRLDHLDAGLCRRCRTAVAVAGPGSPSA